MWAYPQQGSCKMKLREMYKDYSRFNSQAKKLKTWILKEFSEQKQLEKMATSLLPNLVEAEEQVKVFA
jgi:hypothetical protein